MDCYNILASYFYCKLKAHYYIQQRRLGHTNYSTFTHKINKELKKKIIRFEHKNNSSYQETTLQFNFQQTININLEKNDRTLYPIFITHKSKLVLEDKLFFSFVSKVISLKKNITLTHFKVFLSNQKITKIRIYDTEQTIDSIFEELQTKPMPIKTKHCYTCCFLKKCHHKWNENNDLRLLNGMNENEVQKWNNKGFFTIRQLSYKSKFKKTNPSTGKKGRYKFELKALALREQKTLVLNPIKFTPSEVDLFIDFEGIPNERKVYLIGVLIVKNKVKKHYSFWAKNKAEEKLIFNKLFSLIQQFKDPKIYHYGNYEIKELKRFNSEENLLYATFLNNNQSKFKNILEIFYSNIYPPTYSNSLKDICKHIGFSWSNKNSSGINSILWRKYWELKGSQKLKNRLITYNIEDCYALYKVKKWLESLISDKSSTFSFKSIKNQQSSLKFGAANFQLDNFNKINETAYFDYQRKKVFIRTNPIIKKIYQKEEKAKKRKEKPNTISFGIKPENCIRCNHKKLYVHQKLKRTLIDLKFTKYGIRKWVKELRSNQYRCAKCNATFVNPNEYRQPVYGPNINIWIAYNYIQYNISYESIKDILKDCYKVNVTRTFIGKSKNIIANIHKNNYAYILKKIVSGQLIHIDETKVKVRNRSGYVWVITNLTSVYYLYRPNRETSFLKELLKGFNGILISDFYSGYNSLECDQQKCLIHLLRDINDLILSNQLNKELLEIAENFGDILKEIVSTVDKYGLKKRNLKKHTKTVSIFIKKLTSKKYESDIADKLRKRILKNKDKLFTFLNHDNIPWNNNNAEKAIKGFARYRKVANGMYNESGLKDYLVLLSISQTCKYQGKSFFEYLKSYPTIPLN